MLYQYDHEQVQENIVTTTDHFISILDMPSKRLRRARKAITSFDSEDFDESVGQILSLMDDNQNTTTTTNCDIRADCDDTLEDLEAYDDKRHVSFAPLHLIYKSTRNINQDDRDHLSKTGIELKRGKWSKKETKRLLKNWKWICKHYPSFSDETVAFGVLTRVQSTVRITEARKKYNKFRFMRRMAYKLDTRLICDIYDKCRKLIGYKKFKHTSAAELPDDVRDNIAVDIQKSEALCNVSCKYDISPALVDHIKRTYQSKPVRHKWTAEEDLYLESAIERQFDNACDIHNLTKGQIDWTKVRKELKSCGLVMTEPQIYGRWYRKHRSVGCSPGNENSEQSSD